jgi:hypothetical protein
MYLCWNLDFFSVNLKHNCIFVFDHFVQKVYILFERMYKNYK